MQISETHCVVDEGTGPVEYAKSGDAKRCVGRAFIEAVQGREGGVRAPYEEALRTHRVGCALRQSELDGAPVRVSSS